MKKEEIELLFAVPVTIITLLWVVSYLLHTCMPDKSTWYSFATCITILFFGAGVALLAGALTIKAIEKINK